MYTGVRSVALAAMIRAWIVGCDGHLDVKVKLALRQQLTFSNQQVGTSDSRRYTVFCSVQG